MVPGVYVCIFFENGRVIEARSLEGADPDSVCAVAAKMMDQHKVCTDLEVWADGKKVRTLQRGMAAHSSD